MDDRNNAGKLLLALVLVAGAVGGVWYLWPQATQAGATIDDSLDAFVPEPSEFQRRLDAIDTARELTDLANARQAGAMSQLK